MNETNDTADSIEWAEPPAAKGGQNSRKWAGIADGLRARPGQWALVARDVSGSVGSQLKNGQLTSAAKPGEFEVTTRANGYMRAHVDIYARYVGGGSS